MEEGTSHIEQKLKSTKILFTDMDKEADSFSTYKRTRMDYEKLGTHSSSGTNKKEHRLIQIQRCKSQIEEL